MEWLKDSFYRTIVLLIIIAAVILSTVLITYDNTKYDTKEQVGIFLKGCVDKQRPVIEMQETSGIKQIKITCLKP